MKLDETITKKTEVFQFKLEPSLKAKFIAKAEREGMSPSARMRMLIRNYLDDRWKKA